jgi:hypothetical protein
MSQEQDHNEFDKLFKQRLEGYEMSGSDELWDSIEGNFTEIDAEKKQNRKFIFFKWLSAGLIVLLLSTVTYYEWRLNSKISIASNTIANTIISENEKVSNSEENRNPFSVDSTIEYSNQTLALSPNHESLDTSDELKRQNQISKNQSNTPHLVENVNSSSPVIIDQEQKSGARVNSSNKKSSSSIIENKKIAVASPQSSISTVSKNIYSSNSTSDETSLPLQLDSGHLSENRISSNANDISNDFVPSEAVNPILANTNNLDSNRIPTDSIYTTSDSHQNNLVSNDSLLPKENIQENETISEIDPERNKTKSSILNHISIMPYFSPEYGYRRLGESSENSVTDKSLNDFVDQEKGTFSFSTGAQFNYALNKNFSIFTGIQYSKHRQKFNSNGATAIVDPVSKNYSLRSSFGTMIFNESQIENPSDITVIGNRAELSFTSIQTITSFKIPIGITYGFNIHPKQRLFLQSGLLFSFTTKSTSILNLGENNGGGDRQEGGINIQNFQGIKNNNLDLSFGFGYELLLGQRFYIILNPTFRTAISPIHNQYGIKTFPYSFGLITGLKIQL